MVNSQSFQLGFINSQINIFVLNTLVNDLYIKGADAVILGCTELSLLELDDNKTIDPLKVVALKVIEMAYG